MKFKSNLEEEPRLLLAATIDIRSSKSFFFFPWRYNPVQVLTSSTICLQWSLFRAAHLQQDFFLRVYSIQSRHRVLGLPRGLYCWRAQDRVKASLYVSLVSNRYFSWQCIVTVYVSVIFKYLSTVINNQLLDIALFRLRRFWSTMPR